LSRAFWFVSSESALQIPTEMIHYGMTETEQLAVARGLAESLAGTKVTVNSVLPGPTASVVYVCSAVASTTTGAAVRIDGGVVRAIV
jgi:NAD(P)-dependent dehydrogenase (short-subunit alcohol dehydrogenase family)